MGIVENQIKDLQKERKKNETEVASAKEAVQKAQKAKSEADSRNKVLSTKLASLQHEANDLATNRSLIEVERQTAKKELAESRQLLTKLKAEPKLALSKERGEAVELAVKTVNEE